MTAQGRRRGRCGADQRCAECERGARSEDGSAIPFVVACLGLLLLVGAALGVTAAMIDDHRRAQAAADLAALAAAADLQRGADGCSAGVRIATANGARLVGCDILGEDVTVTVRVRGPRWLGASGDLTARARAGPS
jgi:secretion/DNA translocation related TadE-like protein